ncbi:MAG TPA: glycosyltransferase [Thermoanaerobaculia bacterium]|jgi:glycosyltransferase involved in cell wall biosynthesis|nr:glycosyltransferase [Thermoanaerobaculia bacterium]
MTSISVVMSVYNGAKTLAETIDSILAQTERDFEFIIVDDGSTDETPAVLAAYATRDSRIRGIRQENGGLTRALIAGCDAARGDLIARQDCGDLSRADRLRRQKALFDASHELAFVSCWTQFAGPELEPLFERRGNGPALSPISILDPERPEVVIDGPTCHPSVMFRREAYERAGGYRAEFYFGQDWDLWYRLGAVGKFQIIPDFLYYARVTPESISTANRSAQQAIGALSYEALVTRGHGQSDAGVLQRAAAIRSKGYRSFFARARGLYFIGEALRRRGDARGRTYLRRAIAACPLLVTAWIRYAQSLIGSRR